MERMVSLLERLTDPLARPLAVALLPLALLAGCASTGTDAEVQNLPPARRRPPADAPVRPAPPTGLTALPSPQSVVGALPVGRPDPFAAVAPSRAATAPGQTPGLPELQNFRFNGVIRSGGTLQALVQLGDQSGPLCQGPRGACPGSGQPALLPAGWSVAAIDATNGCLTLVHGRERQRQCLS